MDHEYLEQVKHDLEQLILELREKNTEVPIVVEGDKDLAALAELDMPGLVIKINQGKTLFNLVEEWSRIYTEMIILTDWDRTGGRLARVLSEDFTANGMKYDLEFRKRLARLVKKEIKDIESLPKFIQNLNVRLATRTQAKEWKNDSDVVERKLDLG